MWHKGSLFRSTYRTQQFAALFSCIGADRPDFVWFHDPMAGEPRDLYAQVVETALDRINNDCPTDDDLSALSFIFGPMLMPALTLVDRGDVNKISLPNGRQLYRVTGTKGKSYTVYPADVRQANAYCPCAAFTYSCLVAEQQLMCKHVLAVRIAEKTGRCKAIVSGRDGVADLLPGFRA
ncbi:hypothetical protein HD553DRAFT_14787 [Filobasidium floriforme]|uniref:uncharacterized protein n=1 Tax=Filobasidium floriforme TaxID=5210 RepID=UPI001E8D9663|nr:uncharacterized protein HD553DRAFT_14787 [Filobasidium floriforme]KAH8090753.1 hypothetical protein HD553DRAFT_14787 [Filobasidium floriforme]